MAVGTERFDYLLKRSEIMKNLAIEKKVEILQVFHHFVNKFQNKYAEIRRFDKKTYEYLATLL